MRNVVNRELATKLLSSLIKAGFMTALCFSLFSYGLLIFTLIKLPEKFWDLMLLKYSYMLTYFSSIKKRLPLFGEIYLGEELLLGLQESETKISLGIKILPKNLARYKFYTDLLEQLFESHRKMGIGIKKFIPEIRLALIGDLKFERKILSESIGTFLQFLVIALTTWSFVILSSSLVSIPLNMTILLCMVLFQTSGVLLFFYLLKYFKSKTFNKFNNAFQEIYLFSTLLDVGIALNEALDRSALLNGSFMTHKAFFNLSTRVKKLIERLKTTGLSPKDEVQEIIEALWQEQEETFLKFTKIVQVIKFGILAFFFLPAYFLYLYSIFKFFMEQ